MNIINRARRGAPLVLAVIAASGLIAACGSASSTSSSTSTAVASASSTGASTSGSATARRTALEACLKSHGVTLPARPPGGFRSASGTTGTSTTSGAGGAGAGGFFRNPKMQAALKACGANFGGFGGGRFLGRVSHTAIENYATCLRQHGVNVPAPNFSGKGPTFPSSIRSNAKFPAASQACQHLLVPNRAGGTGTTSNT